MECMNRSSLHALHIYNVYANNLVLKTAAKMTEEELTLKVSPSHGTVQALLQHIFDCEFYFATRCMNIEPDPALDNLCSGPLASLCECFKALNMARENYLAKVSDFELQEDITVNLGQGEYMLPRWQFMAQSLLHSVHHRGELSIVMTGLGYPLPTLDPILKYIHDSGQVWR